MAIPVGLRGAGGKPRLAMLCSCSRAAACTGPVLRLARRAGLRHSVRGRVVLRFVALALPGLGLLALADGDREVAGWGMVPVAVLIAVVGFAATRPFGDSVSALSRASAALAECGPAARCGRGAGEIDRILAAMAGAAASLRSRAEERNLALAALRESEARLRDFAEIGSDWYWETGPDHRFTYTSTAIRQFGQDPDTRLGRTRQDLAAPHDAVAAKWAEHLRTLDRHEPFRDFVYTRRVGDQPEQVVSVNGKPRFDAAGRFLGYRGAAREITEAARAERRLREAKAAAEAASRAKSEFLANTSHELRTPLNAVIGFSEALLAGTFGSLAPRQHDSIGYIHRSGEHLLRVINDILDLARVEVGRLDLNEERGIDPGELAEASLELLRAHAAEGGLRLAAEVEEGMPRLFADRTRLKQILRNLLSNAIKFTEPGGSIVLALSRDPGGGVRFEVRDNGLGMTLGEIETALEPFGRIDTGLTRSHEGTGLGLPLARRLAELHQGSLDIASTRGHGTTVTLRLPAARVLPDRQIV